LNSDEVETTENATDDNEKKGDDKKKEKQDYARQFAIKKNYICDATRKRQMANTLKNHIFCTRRIARFAK
jgi:predicted transglutaminase-like protease